MNIGETPPIKPDAAALAVAISNLGKAQVKHGQAVCARINIVAAVEAAKDAEKEAEKKVAAAQREVGRIMSDMQATAPAPTLDDLPKQNFGTTLKEIVSGKAAA